jgi:DNA-binding transcriptional LysR family regulator
MNFQNLRYLLAVSKTGSFTQAATAMRVTQPTISGGISELESELGVRLFNRGGRQVELTIEGRTLANYAVQIQDLIDEAGDRLGNRETIAGANFQFGSIDAAVIYLVPNMIKTYLAMHPEVKLSVQVAPSRQLVEDLLGNRSEFAFITMPFDHPRLETLSLYQDRLLLVVGATHTFARKQKVTLEQVVQEPLILFDGDSVSRRIIDQKFVDAGVSPRVIMTMSSPEAMRKLVEVGVGISFLPYLTVRDALRSGALKEVSVRGVSFSREIGLAWKKGRYFGPAIQNLVTAVVKGFDQEAAFRKLRDRPHRQKV